MSDESDLAKMGEPVSYGQSKCLECDTSYKVFLVRDDNGYYHPICTVCLFRLYASNHSFKITVTSLPFI